MTTQLTADEITTFAELFGHELTVAQMEHLEEWVTTHRAEAIVMHQLGLTDLLPNPSMRCHLGEHHACLFAKAGCPCACHHAGAIPSPAPGGDVVNPLGGASDASVACPCYLHLHPPMPLRVAGPCICECDHVRAIPPSVTGEAP